MTPPGRMRVLVLLVVIVVSVGLLSLVYPSTRRASAQSTSEAQAGDLIVGQTVSSATLRKTASSSGGALASLATDTAVTIIGQERGQSVTLGGLTSDVWYKVRVGEGDEAQEGYIWSGLLNVLEGVHIPATWELGVTRVQIPPNTTLLIQGHTLEEEALLEEIYTLANDYMLSLGVDLESLGPLEVFLFKDRDRQVSAVANYYNLSPGEAMQLTGADTGAGGQKSDFGGTFIWTGQAICGVGYAQPLPCSFPGEYIGTIFIRLAGWSFQTPVPGARGVSVGWLLDGASGYLGNQILANAGFNLAADFARTEWINESRHVRQRLNDPSSYGNLRHTLGSLAVEYLLSISGDDPKKIFDFYAAQRQYPPAVAYRAAFEDTFGMSLDEFYEDFEVYRAAHWPFGAFEDNIISGTVINADGNPVLGVWVWACPLNPTYDCVPMPTIFNYPGTWWLSIYPNDGPVDVFVALSTTPNANSIFGYFSATGETQRDTNGVLTALGSFTTDRAEAEAHLVHVDGGLDITIRLPADLDIGDMLPVACTWLGEPGRRGGAVCPLK